MTVPEPQESVSPAKKRPKVPASDRVRGEWLRRVEAEYRSAAITQHLTLWLIQSGASPDLIKLGMRVAADEIAHADLSHRCYAAAGGNDMPQISRESLQLRRHEHDPLELDVTRVCVDVFCIGETVAVPLFSKLREGCTVPAARRVLDRVLRDEVRHRDFGWMLLTWLLEHPMAPAIRETIERELPSWFVRIRAVYAPSGAESKTTIAENDRAWGLMPPAKYGDVLRRALERDWVPRFAKLGFDATKAWNALL
jgi:hypothetical protein